MENFNISGSGLKILNTDEATKTNAGCRLCWWAVEYVASKLADHADDIKEGFEDEWNNDSDS